MIDKIGHQLDQLFDHKELRIIGYEKEDFPQECVVFTYQGGDTFLACDLHVQELICDTRGALAGLLTYPHP